MAARTRSGAHEGNQTSSQAATHPETNLPSRRPESRARLVVELSKTSASLLEDLVDLEELNKTTVVNRAIQVYALLRKAEAAGGQVLLVESDSAAPQRIRFL